MGKVLEGYKEWCNNRIGKKGTAYNDDLKNIEGLEDKFGDGCIDYIIRYYRKYLITPKTTHLPFHNSANKVLYRANVFFTFAGSKKLSKHSKYRDTTFGGYEEFIVYLKQKGDKNESNV